MYETSTMFNRAIIQHLKEWKERKEGRKPLIVRGARQVGKTSAILLFAEQHFENTVTINLESAEYFELFRNVHSVPDFERIVDIVLKQNLQPGRSLLFLDEIQNTPNLIALLRFFYEERPNLHVIAAGSLLEAKLAQQSIAMPVGRVEYAFVHPLTFFEFLEATGEKGLLEFLQIVDLHKADPLPEAIHTRAHDLFLHYASIGGMPEAVAITLRENSKQEDRDTLSASLFTGYTEDIYKYAKKNDTKYIRHILEQAPFFAGERITYENFGGSGYRSREMSEAFDLLEKTMIIHQVFATSSITLPLVSKKKRAKKLLSLDVGLVNYKNGIQSEYLKFSDLNDVYRGKISEQIVGQNILAHGIRSEQPLLYWAREKPLASAEVDFCFPFEGSIVGVEVKSGDTGTLRSLRSFAQHIDRNILIRIYSGKLSKEPFGDQHVLLSLPFYLVNRVFDVCQSFKNL